MLDHTPGAENNRQANESTELERAERAVHAGDRATARLLVARALTTDPGNVRAWLLMSEIIDSDEQRRDCLVRALSLDPGNADARSRLDRSQPKPSSDSGPLFPVLLEDESSTLSIQSRAVADQADLVAQRRRIGYRRVMLAGALTLSLMCGLILFLNTVAIVLPRARQMARPTPQPVLYTATLWCPPCEQAGSAIVLWESVGDGVSRGGKTGELAHGTTVAVVAEEWSSAESRSYVKVEAQGQTGWVPASFAQR